MNTGTVVLGFFFLSGLALFAVAKATHENQNLIEQQRLIQMRYNQVI